MYASNPFEANTPQISSPSTQNPFGSFVGVGQNSQPSQEAQQHASNPWGAVDTASTGTSNFNTFGPNSPTVGNVAPQSQYSSLQQPPGAQTQNLSFTAQNGNPYQPSAQSVSHNPYQQPQLQYGQNTSSGYGVSNPFGVPSPASHSNNAVVVSQNQSNPYNVPQPMFANTGNAVVVSEFQNPYGNYIDDGRNTQQQYNNQGDMWGTSNNTVSRSNPFDPFASSGPPPASDPAFFQAPQHNDFRQPMDYNRPQSHSTDSAPNLNQSHSPIVERRMSFDAGMQMSEEAKDVEPEIQSPKNTQSAHNVEASGRMQQSPSAARRVYDEPRKEEIPTSLRPPSYEYGQKPDVPPDRDPREGESPRNKYSLELARRAPPGASPLPKADLVRKKGFVLSRISFRTIVMKKWKQSFWVQYGPHTMLWFRTQGDFDDWLNNPYHSQAERNFLIKLAVNFVHDLYKPNVRGYQVTQARTKGYGNKLVRQFKLERWMDYGPTIAAAFGSYNPKEVDDLREALVECMRNTPLDGGIRATGAVRQRPPETIEHKQDASVASSHDQSASPERSSRLNAGGYRRESYENLPAEEEEKETEMEPEKPAPEVDLLDVASWDAPTQPHSTAIVASPVNASFGQPQGQSFPPQYPPAGNINMQQNNFPGQQYPVQQQSFQTQSNALAVTNQGYAYPGAPPAPTQQMQLQQSYPGVAPPYGAPQAYNNPAHSQQMMQPMPQQPWDEAPQPNQGNPWMNQQQQQPSYSQPPQF